MISNTAWGRLWPSTATRSISRASTASEALAMVASDTRMRPPYSLLAPSSREARFTLSPITVSLIIISEPILPTSTSPIAMPLPRSPTVANATPHEYNLGPWLDAQRLSQLSERGGGVPDVVAGARDERYLDFAGYDPAGALKTPPHRAGQSVADQGSKHQTENGGKQGQD